METMQNKNKIAHTAPTVKDIIKDNKIQVALLYLFLYVYEKIV